MKIPEFGVEGWLNVHEREAKYDLAQSTITSFSMNELVKLAGSDVYGELDQQKMNYGWIEGSPTFKKEVSKLYKNVDPDNILQTNGATGANMLAIYSLIEPGDHVISVYPSYQQLYDIPKSLGADVSFWKLHEEDNWYPDIEDLKKMIRPNTKMICINNANNPTGTILVVSLWNKLLKLLKLSVRMYSWMKFIFHSMIQLTLHQLLICTIRVFQLILYLRHIQCLEFVLAGQQLMLN